MKRLIFSLLLSGLAALATFPLAASATHEVDRSRCVKYVGDDPTEACQTYARKVHEAQTSASSTVDASDFPSVRQVKDANIRDVAATAINFLLMLAGALAVIFLIVGGIRYIISAGSPDRVEKAKHTILYSIIGIIVIVLSYFIVRILNLAGGG